MHACTTEAHANNMAHTESLAPYTNPKSTYKVLVPHTESNSLSRFQEFSDYNGEREIQRETERERGREMKKSEHSSKKFRTVPLVVFVLYMQYAWNSTLSSMMK